MQGRTKPLIGRQFGTGYYWRFPVLKYPRLKQLFSLHPLRLQRLGCFPGCVAMALGFRGAKKAFLLSCLIPLGLGVFRIKVSEELLRRLIFPLDLLYCSLFVKFILIFVLSDNSLKIVFIFKKIYIFQIKESQ